MQVNTHNAPTRNRGKGKLNIADPKPQPGRAYIEPTGEKFQVAPGRGAETSDRADRAAWAGRTYRSAYSCFVQLPRLVRPADRDTCYRIVQDIRRALDHGGWTTNEWNRLHRMEEAWELRAHGKDLAFNLRGWKKQGTGQHTPAIEKTLHKIRKEFDQCGDIG